MQRLLMGEVGSGKTVVALYAMLRGVESGAQAALMAPTETLAEQHFATLQKLMPGEMLQAALLTGATPAARRADVLGKLASGELKLLVGTHALIEGPVAFDRLAVAVVDEQHRFGVNQRRALDRKAPAGLSPHVLHMTATPIPRTLALTAYGDLDVTSCASCPRGGGRSRPTWRGRARARAGVRAHARGAARGRQAFVVCPLVEESEALPPAPRPRSTSGCATGELRDFRVVLCTGSCKPREKQEAMADFAAGGADVLVATTVIEVGIDVPNATVMLVENAERYGISQLHQLRGRIGRGEHESVCLLFGPEGVRPAAGARRAPRRLRAGRDRPRAARARGRCSASASPGSRSSASRGLPDDAELLERARMRATTLLDADPDLVAPSTRCSPTRSPPRSAPTPSSRSRPSARREGGRGDLRRAAADRAARRRHPPDRRPGGRALFSVLGDAVVGTRGPRPVRRLGARWASRRCRAAPPRRSSSTPRRPRSAP
jgi:ATP-dependent DNA helicase RecG